MGSDQKRAILAVVLSGIILFSWQYFFPAPKAVIENKEVVSKIHVTEADTKKEETKPVVDPIKTSFELKNATYTYLVSSDLSILEVKSHDFPLSLTEVFSANPNKILFSENSEFTQFDFIIEKTSDTTANISNQQLGIKGSVILSENGILTFDLNSEKTFKTKFFFNQKEEELSGGKLKQFVFYGDDLDTVNVGSDEKGDKSLKWFGLDFNYHLFAIVTDKTPKIFNVTESGQMNVLDNQAKKNLVFKAVFSKKEYDKLVSLGDNLHLSVDFGFFSILATPILRGLQYFYQIIPNYGVAIILLTILMRLLTFPLQYKSYKSMKKMQEIQPELAKIKEKFKDEPQRMQQETMALFKRAGANPVGGCLPMLLQMPIFFAFYRVLYNAVELVDAPFILWITDLSSKDPYYVLPILMAGAMFFHQKLTPTTTVDPTQQKIMMFMPVIFALFMKDFPAGLTLYIFVSTVVAMIQQLVVFKKN